VEVLGYEEFEKFWEKYKNNDIKINKKTLDRIKNLKKKEWKNFVNENNKYLINDDVIDLLDKMLKFDPSERIKAKDAINHAYFKDLNKLSKNNSEDEKKE
jgi:casein kinase II subunit alpha